MNPTRSGADAWRALTAVTDPELPILSIVDLGMVRSVTTTDDGQQVRVTITPTFTACPAMSVITHEITAALTNAGFSSVAIDTVLAPPWTTDWMTESARDKLKAYGIAPPIPGVVACPRCASTDSECLSTFGSTPCKSLYRCRSCLEPFERFKCV